MMEGFPLEGMTKGCCKVVGRLPWRSNGSAFDRMPMNIRN